MLTLSKGLVGPGALYSLPLSLTSLQWDQLETVPRVALRVCLGIPGFVDYIPTFVEGQSSTLLYQAENRALPYMKRL